MEQEVYPTLSLPQESLPSLEVALYLQLSLQKLNHMQLLAQEHMDHS